MAASGVALRQMLLTCQSCGHALLFAMPAIERKQRAAKRHSGSLCTHKQPWGCLLHMWPLTLFTGLGCRSVTAHMMACGGMQAIPSEAIQAC